MITITNIQKIKNGNYDEVWAIVRSNRNIPEGVMHVPELSPSWGLFNQYQTWKQAGIWNKETFQTFYVPRFLMEMQAPSARAKLAELVSKSRQGKSICLYCYCPDESLCHRSIVAGILQWVTEVIGIGDYRQYGKIYWDAAKNQFSLSMTVTNLESCKSVCFTGPRPKKLNGYQREAYNDFVKQLSSFLEQYAASGVSTFISGGAQGFDQLSFWAVHRLKKKYPDIRNVVYVPFPGQESVWLDTGCFSKSDYTKMLSVADKVRYVAERKPDTKGEIVTALFMRNQAMVDDTDRVIALSNDFYWEAAKSGGTIHCMKYAKNVGRTIDQLVFETKPVLTLEGCIEWL